MELEQGKNVDFWRDMTIITEDEIAKLRKLEASGKGGPGEQGSRAWCGYWGHPVCSGSEGLSRTCWMQAVGLAAVPAWGPTCCCQQNWDGGS